MEKQIKGLIDDIIGNFKGITNPLFSDNGKSAFGDLISSQLTQTGIISKTYESEICGLTNKMEKVIDAFKDKIAGLEADKENLETELANLKKNAKKTEKNKK